MQLKHTRWLFITLLVINSILALGILKVSSIQPTTMNNPTGVVDPGAVANLAWEKYPPYPVCKATWGNPALDVIDFGLLANYAYADTPVDFRRLVQKSYDGAEGVGNATVVYVDDIKTFPRVVAVRFHPPTSFSDQGATTVVAIKGSSTPMDFLADASLYANIEVLKWLSLIVPLLDTVPNFLIAWVIKHVRVHRIHDKEWFGNVIETVTKLQTKYRNDKFVITGHSLGGAFASIVGGRLHIPAVVFSAPGTHFTRFEVDTTMEYSFRDVVGILPDLDEVPVVDRHDDMVQHIECRAKDGLRRKPYECHAMHNTLCELYRVCGDRRQRNFTKACWTAISFDQLGSLIGSKGGQDV